jgi:tetratricopeptide (TPR) repeat protein
VAHVEWHNGRRDRAIALLEESVGKWQESGDILQLAGSHEELADFLRRSGRLEDARANLEEALTMAGNSGDVFTTIWCLRGLGSLLTAEGELDQAARVWGAAEAVARESGLSFSETPSDYEEQVERVRQGLGDNEFERVWSEGAAMSREEVERHALGGW